MNVTISASPLPLTLGHTFGNIPSRYSCNNLYFTKDGLPFAPIAGEFHFSRCPKGEWRRELAKMKANGINVVSTYIFWNHHEYESGQFNFSGRRDIHHFLQICKKIGLPCLLRIGPWAHGECVYGGFPLFVQQLCKKRQDDPVYLGFVKRFWTRLYLETKDFMDGKTVFGIQIENEYNGPIQHLRTLRSIAVEIGFKAPFFTMTAWPTNRPDPQFLPTFGGYPEAPWTEHIQKLPPCSRFEICQNRGKVAIGEDLIKTAQNPLGDFEGYPFAGCEVGVGNQPTQHRRPLIGEKDGFGVAFAKFASGMNWMGYYMYHGGRNPTDRLYQESRQTGYPNNYPVVDYDFQSPFSKDGVLRAHGHRLRLLHTFMTCWDPDVVTKPAYFAAERPSKYPYFSVRCDETLSGYLFVSNYERSDQNRDVDTLSVTVKGPNQTVRLPDIPVKAGAIFFFPFRFFAGELFVDYLLAQPIAKLGSVWYVTPCEGIAPQISVNGCEQPLLDGMQLGPVTLRVLSWEDTSGFYVLNGKAFCFDGVLFQDRQTLLAEWVRPVPLHRFVLRAAAPRTLELDEYLYSDSPRFFFDLQMDKDLIHQHFDTVLTFRFTGLNLQFFCGDKLLDDCFNTSGIYELHTRQLIKELDFSQPFTIRASAATKSGIGHVYSEIDMPVGKVCLTLESVDVMDIVPAHQLPCPISL